MFNNILDSQREQNRVCNRDSAHFLVLCIGQVRTGQVRTGLVNSKQANSEQVKSRQVRAGLTNFSKTILF